MASSVGNFNMSFTYAFLNYLINLSYVHIAEFSQNQNSRNADATSTSTLDPVEQNFALDLPSYRLEGG
jgi:hypothetical protein